MAPAQPQRAGEDGTRRPYGGQGERRGVEERVPGTDPQGPRQHDRSDDQGEPDDDAPSGLHARRVGHGSGHRSHEGSVEEGAQLGHGATHRLTS